MEGRSKGVHSCRNIARKGRSTGLQQKSQGRKQYCSTAVHQYSSTLVQQYSSTAVQQYSSTAVQQYSSTAVQQYCSTAVQQGWEEFRSTGVERGKGGISGLQSRFARCYSRLLKDSMTALYCNLHMLQIKFLRQVCLQLIQLENNLNTGFITVNI